MAYTTNPHLPKLRAKAVKMVKYGASIREVARHYGVNPSTVSRWNRRVGFWDRREIPTRSSRPKHHPREKSKEIVDRILAIRNETNGRCSEVVHHIARMEGLEISLSTVKRILDRYGLINHRSPWKRRHKSIKRPYVNMPGDLVEADTIHLMKSKKRRIYVYTFIDIFSRWAYAQATVKINTQKSITFFNKVESTFPFKIKCLQTDNGPEFSQHFTERIGTIHRHSRVRRPNDNAHLERFNLTIQKELINSIPLSLKSFNHHIPLYINFYNNKRFHLALNFKTPSHLLHSY